MNFREKLARAIYWGQGLADWEDKNKKSLTEFYMTADQQIAIFKEFIDTMELPKKVSGENNIHYCAGWWDAQQDLLKAIKDKLGAKMEAKMKELTDEEIWAAWEKDIYLDHKPTEDEVTLLRIRAVLKEANNK